MNDDLKHLQKLGFRTRSRWDSIAPILDPVAANEENKTERSNRSLTTESRSAEDENAPRSLRLTESPTMVEAKKYLKFVAGLQPTLGVTYKTKKPYPSRARKKHSRQKKANSRSTGPMSVKRFFEEQKSWRDQVISNLEKKRIRTRDDELQRCTFTPKIVTGNKFKSNGHTVQSSKGNIYDRSKKWLQKIERDKTRAKEERMSKEEERCTFKPKLVTKELYPQGRRNATDLYKRVMDWKDKKNWTRTVRRLTSLQDAMRECTFRPQTLCDKRKLQRSNSDSFFRQQQNWKAGVEDRTAALDRKLYTASINPKTEEILNDQWFRLQKQVQNDVDALLDTSELLLPVVNIEKDSSENDNNPWSPELCNPNDRCSKRKIYPVPLVARLVQEGPQQLEIDTYHTSFLGDKSRDHTFADNCIKEAKTGLWESVYNFQRTVTTLKQKLELDNLSRASAPSSRLSNSSDDERSINPNPQENLNPGLQHFCNIMENVQTIMNQSESEHEKLRRRRDRRRLNSTPRSERSELARDYNHYTPKSVGNLQAARSTLYSSVKPQDHPKLCLRLLAIEQSIAPEKSTGFLLPSPATESLPHQLPSPCSESGLHDVLRPANSPLLQNSRIKFVQQGHAVDSDFQSSRFHAPELKCPVHCKPNPQPRNERFEALTSPAVHWKHEPEESTPCAPNPTPSSAQEENQNQFLYDEIRLKHTAVNSPTFRSSLPTTELNSQDESSSNSTVAFIKARPRNASNFSGEIPTNGKAHQATKTSSERVEIISNHQSANNELHIDTSEHGYYDRSVQTSPISTGTSQTTMCQRCFPPNSTQSNSDTVENQ